MNADGSQQGYIPAMGSSLKSPMQGMTWVQLAAVVIFVATILFAWRQVVGMIAEEV